MIDDYEERQLAQAEAAEAADAALLDEGTEVAAPLEVEPVEVEVQVEDAVEVDAAAVEEVRPTKILYSSTSTITSTITPRLVHGSPACG